MIQFDVHIFQMGWFNHQVDNEWTIQSEKIRIIALDEAGVRSTSKAFAASQ